MKKLSFKQFKCNKRKYGLCSSYAIWDDEINKFLIPITGFSIYNGVVIKLNELDEKEFKKINLKNNIVLVGLNFAERKKKQKIDFKKYKYFRNFHEELHVYDKGYTNDVTLKFLCKNIVLFQRAYMTDLIKWKKNDKRVPTGIIESNSEKIFSIYKNNKKKLEIQVNKFIKELQSIGCENPLIVCMGAKTYMLINQFINNILDELGDKTKIIRITHYSRQRGREKEYIKKVKEELKQQKVKI